MPQKILQVDAFTAQPFRGNPAAVCVLDAPREEQWMQAVAQEMNLSETAFLYPQEHGYNLRWFTPKVEVELCGHATLASAHVLWEEGRLAPQQTARFFTRSGVLTADKKGDWLELNFPAEPEENVGAPFGLREAFNVPLHYVGKNRFDYLVAVDSEETLRSLQPDFNTLAQIPVRGVIVTCRSTSSEFDFVSRFFAPRVGIAEDPVTGSAHCCLAPYWAARLNKKEMVGYQASARGGIVRVRVGENRVYIGGQAVTVLRGELLE